MRVGYSVWISTDDGRRIFGEGPCRILHGVVKYGSLRQSAMSMNMAYSKAFNIIRNAEKAFGCKLLVTEIGGKNGGGSKVTQDAIELLRKYEEYKKRTGAEIERIYREIFS